MNAFELHEQVISGYREYLKSFIRIRDRRIRDYVEQKFDEESFIPEPIMQFNPSYQRGESLEELRDEGLIHPGLLPVFGGFRLYRHQVMGIRKGIAGESFVVTSGDRIREIADLAGHDLRSYLPAGREKGKSQLNPRSANLDYYG